MGKKFGISNTNLPTYSADDKMKMDKGKWLFIFISSFIFFIQFLIFMSTTTKKTNYWILDFLFASLLCYLILKLKYYKHHYLSLIINILIGLIIDLAFKNIQNDIKENFIKVLIRLLREILLTLHEVLNKYIMEKKNASAYEICLFNGIINLILLVFFSILNYYFFKLDDFADYFNNYNTTELYVILGVMATQLGFFIFALFTSKNLTPCHSFIIFVFGQFAFHIDFSTKSTIIFISFLLILFMSLIFNEIIELNFWGLSYNIKRNIIKRAGNEDFIIGHNYNINEYDDNLSNVDESSQKDNLRERNESEEIYL